MTDHSDREVIIFTEAVEVPPHERGPLLRRRCGGDEHLRQKLQALLRAYDRLGTFLEEPLPGRPFIERF